MNALDQVRWSKNIIVCLDIIGIWVAFNLSYWLRFDVLMAPQVYYKFFLIFIVIFLLTFYIFDLGLLKKHTQHSIYISKSIVCIFFAGGLIFSILFLLGLRSGFAGRGVLLSGIGFYWLWVVAWRYVLSILIRRHPHKPSWLIIGKPQYIDAIRRDMQQKNPEWETEFISIDTAKSTDLDDNDQYKINNIDEIGKCLTKSWSGVVLAHDGYLSEEIWTQLMRFRLAGNKIYELSDFYEKFWSMLPIFHLKQGWFALSHGFFLLHNPMGFKIKRIVDIACAIILLIMTLPLMLFVAIAIVVSSGNPIVYKQVRTGVNNKEFVLYKFRSMKVDSEQAGAIWAAKKDKRITPFGRFMRITRLDELPQLVNVLKGDMSFIGPRPERPEFVDELVKHIPFYNFRHLVKPGITGWAQINLPYAASFEESEKKMQYDLFYVKNCSLLLDFKIVLKTIKVVLFSKGR